MKGKVRVELGEDGERAAAQYLQRLGYHLLERNHRLRHGEVDLILRDGDTLVFCEVKTKRSILSGHAAEVYGKKQQDRLRRLVLGYIQKHDWRGPVRVDLMALQASKQEPYFEVHHFPDALSFEDTW